MRRSSNQQPRVSRALVLLAGVVVCIAIGFLSYDVTRKLRLLESASSDNVQWTLTQTEVEFLTFLYAINADPVDISQLRSRFDVFFSRIGMINQADAFTELRAREDPGSYLADISAFLDDNVALIDADDAALLAGLPALTESADQIRPTVRLLSLSGLRVFAETEDAQRRAVAGTLTQLALAMAALIGALGLSSLRLYRLNERLFDREAENLRTVLRMKTVMGTSLDGVIITDDRGRILEFSPAAEAIFGYKAEEVRGKEIGGVVVPDHFRKAHDAGMKRIQNAGPRHVIGKGRVRLEAKRADGELFPVELALQAATTDQESILIAFTRDISHRLAAEKELVAARDKAMAGEKMKTDFLATMSHEIRTPLNGLLGNMNLLRDTPLSSLQDRYMRYMESSGRLLMSHISDVLDITRYDAGKLSTLSEPVNISALMQDIIDNQSSTASRNETRLEWGWDGPPLHWINSDYDRLQHVILNLIGNAVKFTRRGKISVTLRRFMQEDQEYLTIAVADTGPGISDELMQHVFDDFVTGNTAYDREVGGTGLGLSIARRFVTALGGQIGVDSVVGKGSTFWVKLPVIFVDVPKVVAPPRKLQISTCAKKVLLVEDNEINQMVAREMLEADGHSVTSASDGRTAVKLAHDTRFDLILMDISMPVMDGRVATREIRNSNGASAQCRILALTANAMAAEQENFISDGMNGVLTKPLSRSALRDALGHPQPPSDDALAVLVSAAHVAETRDALGEEAFLKLRSRFVQEVEDLIVWLHADDARDYIDVADRVHKTAGSAAVFGTMRLRDALKIIEASAKSGDHALAVQTSKGLNSLWRETKTSLLA